MENEVSWEIPTSVSEIPVVSGIPVRDVTYYKTMVREDEQGWGKLREGTERDYYYYTSFAHAA